jgi:hypothetical protein
MSVRPLQSRLRIVAATLALPAILPAPVQARSVRFLKNHRTGDDGSTVSHERGVRPNRVHTRVAPDSHPEEVPWPAV